MDYLDINKRINNEICYNTLEELSDIKLLDVYKNQKSVNIKIKKLKSILSKNNISFELQDKILNDYILELIPAGTKGVIRGNYFNKIVEKYIKDLNLDNNIFDIKFEKNHPLYETSEIPDWYIYDKINKKIIIGMNQLDLWNGGQQLNRGSKYLINNKHNTDNSKLLCVICNKTEIKSNKCKQYNLFNNGFKNNTLCYLNNLKNIIFEYFNLIK